MRSIFLDMNYEIDHQKLSEQIILTAKKASVTAGLYIFLVFILVFCLYCLGIISLVGSPKELMNFSNPQFVEKILVDKATEFMILNTLLTICMHYLLGGVYGIIKEVNKKSYAGLESAFKTVFSVRGLKVLNVIIAVQLISTAISFLLQWSGFALVGLGISFLLQFLTYFAIPAIYIDGFTVLKSIRFSIQTVNQKPGFLMFFIAATYFLSLTGLFFLGIGIILTLPLNYIVAYNLYIHINEQIKS